MWCEVSQCPVINLAAIPGSLRRNSIVDERRSVPAFASIAEKIGAFAVVVSPLYVGVQVNDSAIAVRAASSRDKSFG